MITGLVPWLAGSRVVFGPAQGYRDKAVIANFWSIVEAHRINVFSGVPTIYGTLLQTPTMGHDLSSLDFAVCGAAPMPVELFKRFEKETGIRILEAYGLTESACVASLNPIEGERRIGSIGPALPGQQMKSVILDEQGCYVREARCDETGTIALAGANIFTGYRSDEHNATAWIDCGDGVRWFNTGDLGRRDADGYFWLTGRKKQLIIRGGHNIDPATIEEPLHRHPDVALAAAVGRPDAHAGEVPVAYVQLRDGGAVTESELLAFAASVIGERAAVPKAIRIVPQIPVTAVGKISSPRSCCGRSRTSCAARLRRRELRWARSSYEATAGADWWLKSRCGKTPRHWRRRSGVTRSPPNSARRDGTARRPSQLHQEMQSPPVSRPEREAACDQRGARAMNTQHFYYNQTKGTIMQQQHLPPKGGIAIRRRAASLAVASLFAAAGNALAFEIATGNDDIAMRWDNTVRYNLADACKARTARSSRPEQRRRRPQLLQAARSSRTASTSCPSSTSSRSATTASAVSGAGWYDAAYNSLDNTQHRDREHAGQRLPVAGALSPYTKRYAKGASGEIARRVRLRQLRRRATCRSTSRRASTRVLGRQPAARRRDPQHLVRQYPLDIWKGFATPGTEAKELFRPRGGITLQAQPPDELSIAGQWFYNWQAVRIRNRAATSTIQDALNFGGDSLIIGPNPLAALDPGRTRALRLWRGQDIKPLANSARLATGASRRAGARVARRHDGLLLSQFDRHPCRRRWSTPGLAARAGRDVHGASAARRCRGNALLREPERHDGRRPAEVRQARHVQHRVRQQHPHLRRHAREEHRRRERRRGALVSPEHAAAERPGARCCPRRSCRRARLDRHHGGADAAARRARWATRSTASLNAVQHLPEDAAVRHRDARGRAHVDAMVEGHAERGGVQGPRQLHAPSTRRSKNFSGLAVNFTPTWFQVFPGVDLLAPDDVDPGHLRQRRRLVRRQQGRRQLERGPRARTSTRSTASTSSTAATTATTRPTDANRRA